jgi:polysaccharide biosynthesis protein PslH
MNTEVKSTRHVLFISTELSERGGREQLSHLLTKNLERVLAGKLEVFRLSNCRGTTNVLERLLGRIDGITVQSEAELLNRVSQSYPCCIFIEGSNLGRVARLLGKSGFEIPIVTFYHNVEARFFFDAMRASPSIHTFGVLIANFIAERWAAKYSQRRIFLNNRDAHMHEMLYRHAGTDLLPMALRDEYNPAITLANSSWDKPYALFVGGSFYANVEGIAWYAENVASCAPIETIVVGRGMDKHRTRLQKWGGLNVVGEVDDLAPWYAHAQIIVAPILSGSGMKTKTAEALMHGKPIAGTPEAFEGYDILPQDGAMVCKTPADFLRVLAEYASLESGFNSALRNLYTHHYSEHSMRKKLGKILYSI